MRKLIAAGFVAFAVTSSAVAQVTPLQLEDLRAKQQAAERRAIDQSNQIQALEARLRADQAVAAMAAQTAGAVVPQLRTAGPVAGAPTATLPKYPAMSDAALADSNKRVQDAARNRR